MLCHGGKNERHAGCGVAAAVHGRVDDPAVALAADARVHLSDPAHHIRLADGGAVQRHPEFRRHIVHGARGGQVHHQRSLLLFQRRRAGERYGALLADGSAKIVDDGEPVRVRINREANVRASIAHRRAKLREVLGQRLGVARERRVHVRVEKSRANTHRLQQRAHDLPAHAVHAVDHHLVTARTNARGVDRTQHLVHMAADGVRARCHLPEFVERRPPERAAGSDLQQLPVLVAAEERPLMVEELVRVPFGGVVARGDGDAARRRRARTP